MAVLRLGCLVVAIAFLTGKAAAQEQTGFETQFREFASRHCIGCHGPDVQKRKLRLDKLPAAFDDMDTAATWVHVLDRLSRGDMPPKRWPRPPEKDARAVITGLQQQLHQA